MGKHRNDSNDQAKWNAAGLVGQREQAVSRVPKAEVTDRLERVEETGDKPERESDTGRT